MKSITWIIAGCVMALTACRVDAISIDWVSVGSPGVAGDPQPRGTFGDVSYSYRIGKYEVTNAQYCEFLNAVAKSDPYELYDTRMGTQPHGGITRTLTSGNYVYAVRSDALGKGPGGTDYTYANKPVVYVTWYDAIRFANWLHNGAGNGDTESGAYTLLGETSTPSNGTSITRNQGASVFLPTADEWYKAAYYDAVAGLYFDYPTGTNTVPNNNLPDDDTGNSANFNSATGSLNDNYPYTDVGAYALSASPYGTFDQAGNAFEWTETPTSYLTDHYLMGGRAVSDATGFHRSNAGLYVNRADRIYTFSGFRVAGVEESGDYNADGVVDAADYVTWRKTSDSPSSYSQWQLRFGELQVGNGTGVPEPSVLSLSAMVACVANVWRRCRRVPVAWPVLS